MSWERLAPKRIWIDSPHHETGDVPVEFSETIARDHFDVPIAYIRDTPALRAMLDVARVAIEEWGATCEGCGEIKTPCDYCVICRAKAAAETPEGNA